MAGPSLQDIIRRRQRASFVGRDGQIVLFRENLDLSPEDSRKRYVFNIHGDGGIGKTYLVKQLEHVASEAGALHAYVDESVYDIPETLLALADQLGKPMDGFRKTYQRYLQRREQLLRDPQAPVEAWGRFTRTMIKVGIGASRVIPGAAPVMDLVDADAAAENVDRLRVYLSRKFSDSAVVKLLMNPIEELTSAFVGDLPLSQNMVLFFDTYERTGPMLDGWLLDLLAGKFGPLPPSLVLTIAGREPLDASLWSDYLAIIAPVPLAPFTETEARQLLSTKGVTDETIIATILALSGQLPLLLAMLAEGSPSDPSQIGDPSGTAVERFLRWEHDPARRAAALAGALPRSIDADRLAILVPGGNAADLFDWLCRQPFVSARVDRFEYHEVVRGAMLRLQRTQSPAAWADAHSRLAAACREWSRQDLEAIYHELCAGTPGSREAALKLTVESAKDGVAAARRCAETLRAAGVDGFDAGLRTLGTALLDALDAHGDDCCAFLRHLVDAEPLPPGTRVEALVERGRLLFYADRDREAVEDLTAALKLDPTNATAFGLRGASWIWLDRNDEALADLNRAIELEPDNAWNLARRGEVYRQTTRFSEALADFDRAIELEPDSAWNLARRGETYRQVNRCDEALADLGRAIELEPDNEWPIASRGCTYRLMSRFDEALADLGRAIELDQSYAWAIGNRGVTYYEMGRYDEALAELNRALELEPDHAWTIAYRGITYRSMDRYDEALADLNRAIELEPGNPWLLADRGVLYRSLQRYDEALADLNRAVESDPDYEWAIAHRGQTHLLMESYEQALADFNRAIELAPDDTWNLVRRGATYAQMKRYDEAFADFDRVTEIDPNDAWSLANRGSALWSLERHLEALAYLDRAIELQPENGWALTTRGAIHQEIGDYDRALADLNRAIELQPEYEWAIANRGETYLLMHRYDEALADLDRAVALAPDDPWNLAKRGETHLRLGRYAEALADLDRSLELKDDEKVNEVRAETLRMTQG